MNEIKVLSRTQTIKVRGDKSVGVFNAGPAGPRGYKGDEGPILDIPQLGVLPITVMGHSWTVPAGWHSTGNHWTQRLDDVGLTGAITNQGVSGTTMEFWAAVIDANPAGAYAAWDWGRPSAKTLCLMMNVLNSAAYQATDLATSLDSFEHCARTCAATVVSDRLTWLATGIAYDASWPSITPNQAYTGTMIYKYTNTAKMTYTSPVDHDYLWLTTIGVTPSNPAAAADSVYRLQVDGETVYEEGRIIIDDLGASDTYAKVAIPVGPITTGQVVTWEKVSGSETSPNAIYFDGFMTLNSKHHIAFTKDPKNILSDTHPQYSVESISAHNAVLDDIKAEFDAIAPDLVSIVDLEDVPTFDAETMLWSGDTLHPNDKGQPWLTEELAKGLRTTLPYTTRLHTL